MNKQQALEALLAKLRTYEERGAEVPVLPVSEAYEMLGDSMRTLEILREQRRGRRREALTQYELIRMGALVLHLLRDEVEVVAGRGLDEWLAAGGGVGELRPASMGAYEPKAVNGA